MPLPTYVFEKEFAPIMKLIANSACQKYHPGEIVFFQGYRYDHFFWVKNGMVKISILSETGEEKVLGFHKNSMFGMDLWGENSIAVVTATAYTNADIYSIPRKRVKRCLEAHPEMSMKLLTYTCDIMRLMVFHMHSHLFLDAKTRIADILYLYAQMGENQEEKKRIYMTEQELSELTGISRVHAARILKEFRQQGLIQTQRGMIVILEEDRLYKNCKF